MVKFRRNGYSPTRRKFFFEKVGGEIISIEPVSINLIIELENKNGKPVSGVVELLATHEQYYRFENGKKMIDISFDNRDDNFNVNFESKIILIKPFNEKLRLRVRVKSDGEVYSKNGEYIWFPICILTEINTITNFDNIL